jgi:3',5'-nucleoside bisphosphate phosphatase
VVSADLHVHTALSPCADPGMTPEVIVREARRKGLALIAVCDHNSARNARPVQAAAVRLAEADGPGEPLTVLAGIEITTAEEVHLLGLFPTLEGAEAASDEVAEALPAVDPDRPRFGQQTVFALDGLPAGEEVRPLCEATRLDLGQAVALVRRHGGLPVPAHVDRQAHGVFGQLGFFPEGLEVEAVEVTRHVARSPFASQLALLGLPWLCSSDAHAPEEIASGMTLFEVERPSLPELLRALRREGGRGCWYA